jgi:pilus assembly protein CpaF
MPMQMQAPGALPHSLASALAAAQQMLRASTGGGAATGAMPPGAMPPGAMPPGAMPPGAPNGAAAAAAM